MLSKPLLVSYLVVLVLAHETGSAEVMRRMGCFKDRADRDMLGWFLRDNMTRAFCVNHCKSNGFLFAGLQARRECSCDNAFGRYGPASDSECREACAGNSSVTCGGNWVNEIFATGLTFDGLKRIGCYKDMPDRDLLGIIPMTFMTREFCLNICKSKGFHFAGLQARRECSCGNTFGRYGRVNDSDCRAPCAGSPNVTCGGNMVNEIFQTGLKIDGMVRFGCYMDLPNGDMLVKFNANLMTRELCVNYCKSKGFMFAGLQAGHKCGCANYYGRDGGKDDSQCREPCSGDPSVTCGGNLVDEIFETGLRPVYMLRVGCFKDGADRDMAGMFRNDNMKRELCVSRCKSMGLMFAGLQARAWCSCDDNMGSYGPAKNSDCRERCLGDPSETCGGNMVNEVFTTGVIKYPWDR